MPEHHPPVHLIEDHTENCRAVPMVQNGEWDNPWSLNAQHARDSRPEVHTRFDNTGQPVNEASSAYAHWTIFICNSYDCNAWGIYDSERICTWIEHEIQEDTNDENT